MNKTTFINAFKKRTKTFAAQLVLFYDYFPKDNSTQVILGKQLICSATPIAAIYRATGTARSDREFSAKLSMTGEEAQETLFRLKLFKQASKAGVIPI